jgi:hypothetical protein
MKQRLNSYTQRILNSQEGKIGYILAWMLGIPVPVLLAIYVLRGCD